MNEQPASAVLGAQDERLDWWRRIMDAVPFGVLLVDAEHRIICHNSSFGGAVNVPNAVGHFCPSLVHGLEGPYPGCPLEQAELQGGAVETELYDAATKTWTLSAVYPTAVTDARGRPLYLHFARDVTAEKGAAEALAHALEHHKALVALLQALQSCQTPEAALESFMELALSLSWMQPTRGAAVFLVEGESLKLVASRSVTGPEQHCRDVPLGSCLCGQAALERRPRIDRHEHPARLPVLGAPDPERHAHVTYPLVYEGRSLGVITFYLRPAQELGATQEAFLAAASGVTAAALAERVAQREVRTAQDRAIALERSVRSRVIASQEAERKRVARELHDDLGQSLNALLLDVKTALVQRVSSAELAGRLESSILELIVKVKGMAWDLRPAVLDDFGLDSALSKHIGRLTERTGLPVDYQFRCLDPVTERLPSEVEVVLYRITQEALHNVVRHADAKRASVVVLRRADAVVLLVEDDGRGFEYSEDATDQGGLGLTGMRERVALLSGKIEVESSPGSGTSLRVVIPVTEALRQGEVVCGAEQNGAAGLA
jgi:signal transduction histidine kinase